MIVVFRVDASSAMGGGHIMRCRTLARELYKKGARVEFICREYDGNLIHELLGESFVIHVLPASANKAVSSDSYKDWLGVSQQVDADETIAVLNGQIPDLLVVDHYSLDVHWEKKLRPYVKMIMVIDDLANRMHDCDLLLDQNYHTVHAEVRYEKLVPKYCRNLIGPDYALLNENYRFYGNIRQQRKDMPETILIYMGGIDPANLTCVALQALSEPEFGHLDVMVVMGANNPPHKELVEKYIELRPLTTLYPPQECLAALMSKADIFIGAGGATSLERLCLGVPTILVSLADNQVNICKSLAEADLVKYIGRSNVVTFQGFIKHISEVLQDKDWRFQVALKGQALVDGLGTYRVAELLMPISNESINMRRASEEDERYLNRLINLHQQDLRGLLYLRSYILRARDVPLGAIQIEIGETENIVSVLIDPVFKYRQLEPTVISLVFHLLGSNTINVFDSGKVKYPASGLNNYLRLYHKNENSSNTSSYLIAVISDSDSWINSYIPDMVNDWLMDGHTVLWVHEHEGLQPGDFCFYLGLSSIVSEDILGLFRNNLVVHGSALPEGKGWSPLTWQVLEGATQIPVTLFEAEDKVDSGVIYAQDYFKLNGYELIDELREKQAASTMKLCRLFVNQYPGILSSSKPQVGTESFYKRRISADSELNPAESLIKQFNLLRVADNIRYPCFFELNGNKYKITIDRMS